MHGAATERVGDAKQAAAGVVGPVPGAAGGVGADDREAELRVVLGDRDGAVGAGRARAVAAGVVFMAGRMAERIDGPGEAHVCVVREAGRGAARVDDLGDEAARVGAVGGGLVAGVDDDGRAPGAVEDKAMIEDPTVAPGVDAGGVAGLAVVFEVKAAAIRKSLVEDAVAVVAISRDLGERVVDLDEVLAVVYVADVGDETVGVGIGQVDLDQAALVVVMEADLAAALAVNGDQPGSIVVTQAQRVAGAIAALDQARQARARVADDRREVAADAVAVLDLPAIRAETAQREAVQRDVDLGLVAARELELAAVLGAIHEVTRLEPHGLVEAVRPAATERRIAGAP